MQINEQAAQWTYEQLTAQLPEVMRAPYDGYARSMFMIDTSVPAWAESYTTSIETSPPVEAEITGYHSTLPNVLSFNKRMLTAPVVALGDVAIYNVQTVAVAQSMGTPLDSRILTKIQAGIYRKEDRIVFRGDTNSGIYGIGNHPMISQILLASNGNANGYTNTSRWDGKTPDQILSELGNIIRLQQEVAEELGSPTANTLALPSATVTALKTRLTSANNQSIWNLLVATFPELNITGSSFLNSLPLSSIGGVSSAAMLYNRDQALSVVIPRDTTIEPTQAQDLELRTPAHSRFGGIRVFYPESVSLLIGI